MFRLDQHTLLIMGSTIITELPRVQISFPGGGGGGGNLCGQCVKTALKTLNLNLKVKEIFQRSTPKLSFSMYFMGQKVVDKR